MLELKNVSFEVSDEKAQKEIIRGINLKIDDNKFVVITGPNGGGKSTLAKLIVGIEKPTSGQILFNGEDITEKSITERAKMGISFAFQQPVRFKGIQVLDLIRMAAGRSYFKDGGRRLFEAGGNATITGDMLTTVGNNTRQDQEMLTDMGFQI